jgi:hypothetical protein
MRLEQKGKQMHIERIAAKNFKCFSSVDLRFPELTFLTGANSSGKSSLLDALLVPLQSEGFPFYLSLNGEFVAMGDFIEMSFCKKPDRKVGINLEISSKEYGKCNYDTSWIIDKHSSLPHLNHLLISNPHMRLEVAQLRKTEKFLLNLDFDLKAYKKTKGYETAKTARPYIESVFIDKSNKKQKAADGIKRIFSTDSIHKKLLTGVSEIQWRVSTQFGVLSVMNVLKDFKGRVNFIDSFRNAPERTYYEQAKSSKVGRAGENHIDQLIEWERQRSPYLKALIGILNASKLASGLSFRRIRGGRFEVRIKPNRGGVWSVLPDVGFGVSQFLPIVVADIQLGRGSTLIVAQPEIHLHPSVQASLGDYFVEMIHAQDKHYIIETHSEYLLNRIRLLISKGKIEPSKIAVYHFQRQGCETKIYPIEFTKSGKIEGAPQDFFDTYMMDVMDLALSAS